MGDLKHHLWGDKIHRLLAVSWLPWQPPGYRTLWLCERLQKWIGGSLWESVLRLKDHSSTPTNTAFSALTSKGGKYDIAFEAIGYSSKTNFNLGLWGVGNWKSRTGVLYGRELALVAVSSELGLRPYTSWKPWCILECWIMMPSWLVNSSLPCAGGSQNWSYLFLTHISVWTQFLLPVHRNPYFIPVPSRVEVSKLFFSLNVLRFSGQIKIVHS